MSLAFGSTGYLFVMNECGDSQNYTRREFAGSAGASRFDERLLPAVVDAVDGGKIETTSWRGSSKWSTLRLGRDDIKSCRT